MNGLMDGSKVCTSGRVSWWRSSEFVTVATEVHVNSSLLTKSSVIVLSPEMEGTSRLLLF